LDAAAEAVEGAKSHVLLVGDTTRRATQALAGQPDQPRVVALPQRLGRLMVAGPQVRKQRGHRPHRGHRLSHAVTVKFDEKKCETVARKVGFSLTFPRCPTLLLLPFQADRGVHCGNRTWRVSPRSHRGNHADRGTPRAPPRPTLARLSPPTLPTLWPLLFPP